MQENYADSNVIIELGFSRTMMHLASSEDAQVREAALSGLLEISKHKSDEGGSSSSDEDTKLKQILQITLKVLA